MVKFIFSCCLLSFIFTEYAAAQDTLPKISVINRNGKVIISWINTYGATISNINIQRSSDSIKRFGTIGTVLNPMNKENGFVDTKYTGVKMFYRVFVAFEGGAYIFSKSYQPVIDTSRQELPDYEEEKKELYKPVTSGGFVPSKFVFTGKDNNVIISLANASREKYSIHFFDENDRPLFILRHIKEPYLIVDKVNFTRSGWFKYHLYNDAILLEKFKFFIPRDSRNGSNGKDPRFR